MSRYQTMDEDQPNSKRAGIGRCADCGPSCVRTGSSALGWLVFLGLSSGSNLVLPVAVRHMINHGFAGTDPTVINRTFMALFGVALVIALATAARFYCITLLGERSLASLRSHLYDHLIRLDLGFFEKSRVGELISRLGTDTELVQTLVGSGISVALRSVVMLVGATVAMIITSPRLAGLTALVIPAVMLPILIFGRRVRKLSRHSQDRLADASAIANETLNAAQAIKAYSREDTESDRYGRGHSPAPCPPRAVASACGRA